MRRRGNNVAVFKRTGHDARCHETTDVRHVSHQIGIVLTGDVLEALVVQVTGITAHA